MRNIYKILDQLFELKERIEKCDKSTIAKNFSNYVKKYNEIAKKLQTEYQVQNAQEIVSLEDLLNEYSDINVALSALVPINDKSNTIANEFIAIHEQNNQLWKSYGNIWFCDCCSNGRGVNYSIALKVGVWALIPPATPIGILILLGTALIRAVDYLITYIKSKIILNPAKCILENDQNKLIDSFNQEARTALIQLGFLAKSSNTQDENIMSTYQSDVTR